MPVAPLRSIVPARRPLAAVLLIALSAVVVFVFVAAAEVGQEATMATATLQEAHPTVTCEHALVGTWIAHEYRREHRDWVEHELRITDESTGFRVAHTARVRDGNEHGPAAMDCAPAAMEFDTVGSAKLDGDQLHVRGESLVASRARCDGATATYSLDSFSGKLEGNWFWSVNNDGNTAVNRSYGFHRVSCE